MKIAEYIVLLGLGKSGRAVAAWCHKNEIAACIIDDATGSSPDTPFPVMSSEVFATRHHVFPKNTIAVTSPGIPYSNKAFQRLQELKIPIISEVECALRAYEKTSPLIAVTGTNGKTTVVELITHIINASGKKANAVGNIGVPLIEAFSDLSPDWFVVELSSFQLALTSSVRFSIGCLLNVSPNHLDWHSSMDEYVRAKERICALTLQTGTCFVHESVPLQQGRSVVRYGKGGVLRVQSGKIRFLEEEEYLPKELLQAPQHEVDNFLVAYGVSRSIGIDVSTIFDGLMTFKKSPHRIEFVQKIRDISYIDDSKSSNVASTEAALCACKAPVVLIAGGVHKGSSYAPWKSHIGKIQAIVAIGASKEIIAKDVGDTIPTVFASSLHEAVCQASRMITAGTVLLSPGCSSFDMFRDYKDRGRQFKEIVRSLTLG